MLKLKSKKSSSESRFENDQTWNMNDKTNVQPPPPPAEDLKRKHELASEERRLKKFTSSSSSSANMFPQVCVCEVCYPLCCFSSCLSGDGRKVSKLSAASRSLPWPTPAWFIFSATNILLSHSAPSPNTTRKKRRPIHPYPHLRPSKLFVRITMRSSATAISWSV
jgi:hypothetical protein